MSEEVKTRSLYVPGKVGRYYSAEEDLSIADQVAVLSDSERKEVLSDLDLEDLQWDYQFWLRPSQLALVESNYWMTVALSGRGWGKSRVLSEAMQKYAMENPGSRLLLLGRTTSDVRDVMIAGASGILSIVRPEDRPKYNPATRKLTWQNGTTCLCYSAERPDSLRGIQVHAAFCDEVASYRANAGAGIANAFDQVKIATRLGDHPQIFVATTPKRVPHIIQMVKQAEEEPGKVLLVRGPTRANRALSESYTETVEGLYAGTALGRQELEGELLTDVEGALLTQDIIDKNRYVPPDPTWWEYLPYRVIGVDPSVSSSPDDECGIVVVGATGERKMYQRTAYVIEDASMLAAPQLWAKRVAQLARKYRAVVVAEKNQGGELVRMVLKAEDQHIPVVLVHAKISKSERAEPVGAAYEQGRVRHVDFFPELEAQLTSWAPGLGMASPDRLDAVVHGVTSLLVARPAETVGRARFIGNPSEQRLGGVQDHNPANRYPEDHFGRPDSVKPQENRNDRFSKINRSPILPIGNRDSRVAFGGYLAPNPLARRGFMRHSVMQELAETVRAEQEEG